MSQAFMTALAVLALGAILWASLVRGHGLPGAVGLNLGIMVGLCVAVLLGFNGVHAYNQYKMLSDIRVGDVFEMPKWDYDLEDIPDDWGSDYRGFLVTKTRPGHDDDCQHMRGNRYSEQLFDSKPFRLVVASLPHPGQAGYLLDNTEPREFGQCVTQILATPTEMAYIKRGIKAANQMIYDESHSGPYRHNGADDIARY